MISSMYHSRIVSYEDHNARQKHLATLKVFDSQEHHLGSSTKMSWKVQLVHYRNMPVFSEFTLSYPPTLPFAFLCFMLYCFRLQTRGQRLSLLICRLFWSLSGERMGFKCFKYINVSFQGAPGVSSYVSQRALQIVEFDVELYCNQITIMLYTSKHQNKLDTHREKERLLQACNNIRTCPLVLIKYLTKLFCLIMTFIPNTVMLIQMWLIQADFH